jgi:hypothetical protein
MHASLRPPLKLHGRFSRMQLRQLTNMRGVEAKSPRDFRGFCFHFSVCKRLKVHASLSVRRTSRT